MKTAFHSMPPEKVLGEHEPIAVIVISEDVSGARRQTGGRGWPS